MLLDVPPGSSITLDGVTRSTPSASSSSSSSSSSSARRSSLPSPLDRGLWIIDGIPSSSSHSSTPPPSGDEHGGGDFHLLVVRPGTADGGRRALPVGFVLTSPSPSPPSSSGGGGGGGAASSDDGGCFWTFARGYDARIEEMSDETVDGLTLGNVLRAAEAGGELSGSVIPYGRFMGTAFSPPSASSPNDYTVGDGGDIVPPPWYARASSIGADFLRDRHGLSHGSKLLPSSEGDGGSRRRRPNDDGAADAAAMADGGGASSASYPPIPCVDREAGARALARHAGTRAYLSELSPPERTRLLLLGAASAAEGDGDGDDAVNRNPGEYVLEDVLRRYDGRADGVVGGTGDGGGGGDGTCGDDGRGEDYFIADVELSFLLLLHLECHASLEYWRDAVSMCSLATATVGATKAAVVGETTRGGNSGGIVVRRSRFFRKLLSVLRNQLSCIETEFFREVEYSSGENNFLVGALRRLCDACESCVIDAVAVPSSKRKRGDDGAIEGLRTASRELRRLVRDRFGLDLSSPTRDDVHVNDDDDMETDALWSTTGEDYGDDDPDGTGTRKCNNRELPGDCDDIGGDDDDEEDGPVIIPYDQIEASIARSALQSSQSSKLRGGGRGGQRWSQHREEYPLLYAAMSPGEDEVMACARILDEAGDVSLVREAAAYLEEVEAHGGESLF